MATVYGQYAAYGLTSDTADDWREQAACRSEDPELFFPLGNSDPALIQTERAREVCRRCPVAAACLTWAVDNDIPDGIWGGMSEQERRDQFGTRHVRSAALAAASAKSAAIRAERRDARTHCDQGHELTPENTYSDRGQKVCRICRAAYQRAYRRVARA